MGFDQCPERRLSSAALGFATDGGYRYDTIDIGVNNIIPTVPPPTLPPTVVPTTTLPRRSRRSRFANGTHPDIFQGGDPRSLS